MYPRFKRCFDWLSASILLLVIFPVFAVIVILVRIQIGKPVFFHQTRTTKDGRAFGIMKFRSMTEERDANGNLLPDNQRLTKIGNFLRATSLDELPELINIIRGDMAVIGPRPMPERYNDFYTEREKNRFRVRGGLIPPEVMYDRVQPTWDEQLEYEAKYADEISFSEDIKILILVFKGLFTRYNKNYGEYVRNGLDEERVNSKEQIAK